ncbi:hypothetical protein GJ496_011180 [Pomphorhynchus laevis]|nr:hypothetical protein GJ496_011180 [Pomphorhynchus laevis]
MYPDLLTSIHQNDNGIINFLLKDGRTNDNVCVLYTKLKRHKQIFIFSHILTRCRLLRENGRFLPKESFLARKDFLTNNDNGFLLSQKRENQAKSIISDPSIMLDMIRGNAINMVPMVLIGGWINWAFSGFLCTKVPFPLTYRFKPMLQRGVELAYLDPSWVSAVSWFAINVVGLRSLYTLALGEENAADIARTTANQEQLIGQAHTFIAPGQDITKIFKAEHDTISILGHNDCFHNNEKILLVHQNNRQKTNKKTD